MKIKISKLVYACENGKIVIGTKYKGKIALFCEKNDKFRDNLSDFSPFVVKKLDDSHTKLSFSAMGHDVNVTLHTEGEYVQSEDMENIKNLLNKSLEAKIQSEEEFKFYIHELFER